MGLEHILGLPRILDYWLLNLFRATNPISDFDFRIVNRDYFSLIEQGVRGRRQRR